MKTKKAPKYSLDWEICSRCEVAEVNKIGLNCTMMGFRVVGHDSKIGYHLRRDYTGGVLVKALPDECNMRLEYTVKYPKRNL
jgi:hypothetical protein